MVLDSGNNKSFGVTKRVGGINSGDKLWKCLYMKNFILQEKGIQSFSQQHRNRSKFKFQEDETTHPNIWGQSTTYSLSKEQDKFPICRFYMPTLLGYQRQISQSCLHFSFFIIH